MNCLESKKKFRVNLQFERKLWLTLEIVDIVV